MLRSLFLCSSLVLTINQSEAQLSVFEFGLLPITQGKTSVMPTVGLMGLSILSSEVWRYLASDDQKEQAQDTVSFRWQVPTPVTFCSHKSLQVLELPEVEVLSIQPFQKEVQGAALFCATVEPTTEADSRELYVNIDDGGQLDLSASFVGTGEQATPLAQLKPVLENNPEQPSLSLPADLFGGKELLRLDMSGVRVRQTPNGKKGEQGDTASPKSETNSGSQIPCTHCSGSGYLKEGASGSGSGDDPEKPNQYKKKLPNDYIAKKKLYGVYTCTGCKKTVYVKNDQIVSCDAYDNSNKNEFCGDFFNCPYCGTNPSNWDNSVTLDNEEDEKRIEKLQKG